MSKRKLVTLPVLAACALLTLLSLGAGCAPRPAPSPFAFEQRAWPSPGLCLQEGDPATAAALGVPYVQKRFLASRGFAAVDQALADAEKAGVKVILGWMWDNEGPIDATPGDWPRVCWGTGATGCGPNYADPVVRAKALQSIRDLGARYDGHPQVAAVIASVGLDGERRFCKKPTPGDPCYEAYVAAGLTRTVWSRFILDVLDTYRAAFPRMPVYFHYSGYGFHAAELGETVKAAVERGLGLYSSGLYPVRCSGNSYGRQCNPASPLMVDWLVPTVYPDAPFALEQSLPYGPDNAVMAWLWAISRGARQICAQRDSLAAVSASVGRAAVERLLAGPSALWVAWDPAYCTVADQPTYCPEQGDWSRNVRIVDSGPARVQESGPYTSWVTREWVTLQAALTPPLEVRATDGDGRTVAFVSATETVRIEGPVHRVEFYPAPAPTATPTAPPAALPTAEPTRTATPVPCRRWHLYGTIGSQQVDLWLEEW
jgi:hypothetical protein